MVVQKESLKETTVISFLGIESSSMSTDTKFIPFNALLSTKKPTAKEKALDKSLMKYSKQEMVLESDSEMNRRKNGE